MERVRTTGDTWPRNAIGDGLPENENTITGAYGWYVTGEYRSSGWPNGRTGLAPMCSRLVAYVNVVRPGGERTRISSSREPLWPTPPPPMPCRRRRPASRRRRPIRHPPPLHTTKPSPTRYQRTIRSIDGGGIEYSASHGSRREGKQCQSSVRDNPLPPNLRSARHYEMIRPCKANEKMKKKWTHIEEFLSVFILRFSFSLFTDLSLDKKNNLFEYIFR